MSLLVEQHSLMHRLNEGAFGKFRVAIQTLEFNWSAFTLPRIVVVGSETAGKSSLVENITKCAVFPRGASNRGICTKMPVCLELKNSDATVVEVQYNKQIFPLQNREDIQGAIKNAFDKMGDDIKEQEVIVRIAHPEAPSLTLVDLPGIRTFPPEQERQTKALAAQYLSSPDTLVICVVQATDRLTANNAVALTMAKLGEDMKKRAILVLTKPDLVSDAEWEEKVASRLRGSSPELRGVEFARCVSVVSRSQQGDGSDAQLLAQMDSAENVWWPRKLPEAPLLQLVGVQNLISMVDDVVSAHIHSSWKPRATQMLQERQEMVNRQLEELGRDPTALQAKEVLDDICSRLKGIGNGWPFSFEALRTSPQPQSGKRWDWADSHIKLTKEVEDWAQRLLDAPQLLEGIRGIVTKAFEDGAALKTKRFVKMRDELIRIATEELHKKKPEVKGRLIRLVESRLDDLRCKERPTPADIPAVERGVLRVVDEFVFCAVTKSKVEPSKLSLEECKEVKESRERLTAELHSIQAATQTIQRI